MDFSDAFRAEIQRSLDTVDRTLVTGQCKSWEHYKQLTGVREGLKQAEHSFNEIMKKVEQD